MIEQVREGRRHLRIRPPQRTPRLLGRRQRPSERLVEDHAERIKVAAAINGGGQRLPAGGQHCRALLLGRRRRAQLVGERSRLSEDLLDPGRAEPLDRRLVRLVLHRRVGHEVMSGRGVVPAPEVVRGLGSLVGPLPHGRGVRVLVVGIEPPRRLRRQRIDLDARALEEAADAAHQPVALAHDHGVRPELRLDLRQNLLERPAPVGLRVLFLRGVHRSASFDGSVRVHPSTTPTVSTLIPGTISL